jgi:hypothetical protein
MVHLRSLCVLGIGLALSFGLTACSPKPTPPPHPHQVAPPPPKAAHSPKAAPAIHDDKVEMRDDRRDLAAIHDIVEDWHRARKTHNHALEKTTDQRLVRWLRAELAEGRAEVAEAGAEVRASQRELANRGGKHENRDDRRDLADDRKDRQQEVASHSRTRQIADQLQRIQPAFNAERATADQYKKKSGLLRDLQKLSRGELREGREEIREDRQEAKEGPG